MRSTRKLELRRERLTELTTDELSGVAGGDGTTTLSRIIDPCVTDPRICGATSTIISRIIDPCLTHETCTA